MKKQQQKGPQTNVADLAFDSNLKQKSEVSLSLFSFMFSEIVQYMMKQEQAQLQRNQKSVQGGEGPKDEEEVVDVETQLNLLGQGVGEKVLELSFYREKPQSQNVCSSMKREVRIVNMLHLINTQVWKLLFGKQADGLEQSLEDDDEYRLLDKQPITNKYTSTGRGCSLNCSSYIAGIIEGILRAQKMDCKVQAHSADSSDISNQTTIYVIKFDKDVSDRDKALQ